MQSTGSTYERSVVIRKSTLPKAGKGAFWGGDAPIPKSTTIGVYKGEKLTEPPLNTKYTLRVGHLYYDAMDEKKGNWTRYINDGSKSWDGRLRADNVAFTKTGRIMTLRRILPGEEFFVSYGKNYWLVHWT